MARMTFLKLRQRRSTNGNRGFEARDHFTIVCIKDCEQDRFLGVEMMMERAARQLTGIGKVGN